MDDKIISDILKTDYLNTQLYKYKNSFSDYRNVIGELGEKNIHHILKNLIGKKEEQEVKIGNYYVDCFKENIIFEIQNRQFNKIREKLKLLIKDYKTVVIYPIIYKRELVWMNNNGEVSLGKKTTNNSKFNSAFPELYKIKDLLEEKNIYISLILINVCEYKKINSFSNSFSKEEKKNAVKIDKDLLEIVDYFNISSINDYYMFVEKLNDTSFTTKDYKIVNKTKTKEASIALNVLNHLGVVERVGKKDRMYLYKVKK